MTQAQREQLNDFLVGTFNSILTLEERALALPGKGPSVRETHVIEAAAALQAEGRNTMSQVAAALGISVGALTTSAGALVRKGYLTRGADPFDRRVVRISPTEAGRLVNARHEAFHRDMLDRVGEAFSGEDLERLTQALEALEDFFEQYAARG
jgi:DNA-binding MarR family transcriptional regulator